jgi:hypothetical protein
MSDAVHIPPPPHIPAATVAWVIAALGMAGLVDRLGLTADDVAAILGILLGTASSIYAVIERRKGDAAK